MGTKATKSKTTKAGSAKDKAARTKAAKAKATKAKATKAKATKAKATKAKATKAKATKAKATKAKATKAKATKAKATKAKATKAKATKAKTTTKTTTTTTTTKTKPTTTKTNKTGTRARGAASGAAKATSRAAARRSEPRVTAKGGGKKTSRTAAPRPTLPSALERIRARDREAVTVSDLLEVGREVMGIEGFRPGQSEAFEHILAGRDVLAVMPTGSGKSLLYQLTSLILPGLTVVVSPLIALIKDQLDKMKALGVAVARIDSTLTTKQRREMDALTRAPGGKLLLTTPERMADPEFREFLKEAAEGVGVSLFVVDEAHCVSQWGHDFRPSYLDLRKAIDDLDRPQILATTATAPPHVREDILHQLGTEDAEVVTTTFDRPNLHYEVIPLPGDDDKNKTLVTLLKKLPRPGIVYCATVRMVEALHESMSRHGIPVTRYHGRLTKKERDANQNAFMESRDLVMIATNAFGLGVDKPDIRYVLHYHVPGSLEAYAQEAGRGGRDGKPARCVLLFSPDDVAIQEYFLKGTYPSRRQVRAVYNTLKAWEDHVEAEPTIANLAVASRVGTQRTRTVLSLLKDEGFVTEHEGGVFTLAEPPPDEKRLNEKAKQYESRRIADRQRLDALLDYVGTPGCRNQAILAYLGEGETPACGRCDNCLRSKEAAMAAAREASRLEDGVLRVLTADDEEADEVPRTRRVVRTRVIRIDQPSEEEAQAGEAEPRPGAEGPAEAAEIPAGEEEHAEPEADEEEYEYVDEDELEDEEYEYVDEDELEDEDEYEYVEVIDKTAAALAEEGYEPEESEITILARKKVPKQPQKKRAAVIEEEPKRKKRRRRRRRKKNTLPPKEAFTSPVLTKESEAAPEQRPRGRKRRPAAPAGPLVEYVRGPLRINMTPVASATPNDVARRKGKGKKKRKRRADAAGPGQPTAVTGANGGASTGPSAEEGAPKKKRRRRRRRKKGAAVQGEAASADTPIDFFSSTGGNGTPQKKKKRRRRRRGSGKSKRTQQTDGATPSSDS